MGILRRKGRLHRFLLGIEHRQVVNSSVAQFPAQDSGQGAIAGFGNIGNLQHFRMELVSGAHGGNERNAQSGTLFGNDDLGGNRINGIHHKVVVFKIKVALVFRQ